MEERDRSLVARIRESDLTTAEIARRSGLAYFTVSSLVNLRSTGRESTRQAIEKVLDEHETQPAVTK